MRKVFWAPGLLPHVLPPFTLTQAGISEAPRGSRDRAAAALALSGSSQRWHTKPRAPFRQRTQARLKQSEGGGPRAMKAPLFHALNSAGEPAGRKDVSRQRREKFCNLVNFSAERGARERSRRKSTWRQLCIQLRDSACLAPGSPWPGSPASLSSALGQRSQPPGGQRTGQAVKPIPVHC